MKECSGCGRRTATETRRINETPKQLCKDCLTILKNLGILPDEGEHKA